MDMDGIVRGLYFVPIECFYKHINLTNDNAVKLMCCQSEKKNSVILKMFAASSF